jgi:hypothetical protein
MVLAAFNTTDAPFILLGDQVKGGLEGRHQPVRPHHDMAHAVKHHDTIGA